MYDRARVFVRAGAGGGGAVSFRREAHVPRGGPDGGDGGRGGDVVLVCDPSQRDLQSFRRRARYESARGGHGEGGNRHGRSADPLELRVPPGTLAAGDIEGDLRFDLTEPGSKAVVARGGAGGRGNKQFASAERQAPRFAERGLPGGEGWLELRLKLLADVGLVGLPNAGKSSLLARLTRAHPKVASYPFTTVEPALGTIDAEERQVVVADIPGLIEGAGGGAGLGLEFLAHVERTRLLVHVVELAPMDGSEPAANHALVERELACYGAGLEVLPRILCLSKADLVPEADAATVAREWQERLGAAALEVVATSAATGAGVNALSSAILHYLPASRPSPPSPAPEEEQVAEHRVYRPGADQGYRVERRAAGGFRVAGRGLERLVARHDLENEEALRYLEDRLRAIGVIRALQAAGFESGDEVEIGGVAFELDPGAPRP